MGVDRKARHRRLIQIFPKTRARDRQHAIAQSFRRFDGSLVIAAARRGQDTDRAPEPVLDRLFRTLQLGAEVGAIEIGEEHVLVAMGLDAHAAARHLAELRPVHEALAPDMGRC